MPDRIPTDPKEREAWLKLRKEDSAHHLLWRSSHGLMLIAEVRRLDARVTELKEGAGSAILRLTSSRAIDNPADAREVAVKILRDALGMTE